MNREVIVITGPTASGKTEIAHKLIDSGINAEIINMDSVQVYKYLNIGCAKPSKEDIKKYNYHLIDIVEPDTIFSAAMYTQLANKAIRDIISRGKIPLLVGGSGMYLKFLLYGFAEGLKSNPEIRNRLSKVYDKKKTCLYRILKKIAPSTKIHINDKKRIIRALEIYYTAGLTPDKLKEKTKKITDYKFHIFIINMDRNKLYQRANERVEQMIKDGLIEEVKKLIKMGYDERYNSMQSVGYRQILKYLKGEKNIKEAIYEIKRDTRHLIKMQITLFKGIKEGIWIEHKEALKYISHYTKKLLTL